MTWRREVQDEEDGRATGRGKERKKEGAERGGTTWEKEKGGKKEVQGRGRGGRK